MLIVSVALNRARGVCRATATGVRFPRAQVQGTVRQRTESDRPTDRPDSLLASTLWKRRRGLHRARVRVACRGRSRRERQTPNYSMRRKAICFVQWAARKPGVNRRRWRGNIRSASFTATTAQPRGRVTRPRLSRRHAALQSDRVRNGRIRQLAGSRSVF